MDNIFENYLVGMCLVIYLLLFSYSRIKVSFIHYITIVLGLNFYGVYVYGEGINYPAVVFGLGIIAFVIGLIVIKPWRIDESQIILHQLSDQQNKRLKILNFIMIALFTLITVVVFTTMGIPILSDFANTERLTIGQGHGLEIRMLRFAFPIYIICILSNYLHSSQQTKFDKYIIIYSVGLIIIGQVGLGNKSALLTILVAVFTVLTMYIRKKSLRRKLIVFICGGAFLIIVSFIVITIQILDIDSSDAVALLLNRVSGIEGMGFFEMVDFFVPIKGYQFGLGQMNNFLELLGTFRIIDNNNQYVSLPFELSYQIAGVSYLASDAIFPITITPFGDFYYDFGLFGVIGGGFFYGYICSLVYKKCMLSQEFHQRIIWISIQFLLTRYTHLGSIVGYINAEGLPAILILFIYYIVFKFRVESKCIDE